MNILKKSIAKAVRHRWLGIPASQAARALGAARIGRRISYLCEYVPQKIWVEIPKRLGAAGPGFTMFSGAGSDLVTSGLWWAGWDDYDQPMPDLFAALSRDARCVLDIGAFSGFFSLIAATCSPRAAVHAFEPFPPPRAWLERNIAVNNLGGRIHVSTSAVSDKAGEADFFVPAETEMLESSSSLNQAHRSSHSASFKVQVTTLDEFAAANKCGPIDLMKIDVETCEDQVLRGGSRVIEEARPIIFLEILPTADAATLAALRDQIGYVSGILVPTGIDWQNQIQADMEHFNHVFCPVEKREQFEKLVASLGYKATPAKAG